MGAGCGCHCTACDPYCDRERGYHALGCDADCGCQGPLDSGARGSERPVDAHPKFYTDADANQLGFIYTYPIRIANHPPTSLLGISTSFNPDHYHPGVGPDHSETGLG